MRLTVKTKGKAHAVVATEIGPSIWAVECRECPVRRKPGEMGPAWWAETAFTEEHLDSLLEAHLGGRPTGTEAYREVIRELGSEDG